LNFAASIPVAFKALRVNALRSLLAMLGVIIGVGSVIVMVSISDGAAAEVERQISSLGANTLMVRPGSSNQGGRRGGWGSADPMTDDDVFAILNEVPGVARASGELSTSAPLIVEGANWQSRIYGVNEQFADIREWQVVDGRMFNEDEVASSRKVAVIGHTVSEELFGGYGAIGQTMRIRNVPFEIIGILGERGEAAGFGGDQDDVVLVPVDTVRTRLFSNFRSVPNAVSMIHVKLLPEADTEIVTAEITDLMRYRRNILPGEEDDFGVNNPSDFVRARNETQSQLSLLLAWTAAISLVVGGIGIMNIMLVSVTERTREIGLRMALGARAADVRAQFLTESIVLCLSGGLLGLMGGLIGSYLFSLSGEFPVTVNPTVVLIAIVSSLFVGVAFGFYPAHRASKLDPIMALRHE
jgi:putative ABC transport system permease protein